MTVRIGVDTGGTFTDVVLYDAESGDIHIAKTPSTPPDFDLGVLAGIDKILDSTGIDASRVSFLSHGTTVGTNAVLEGEMPDLGLITNEGLRDVLEIGDQTRPDLYDLQTEKPPALVPRYLRREVPGRMDASGTVVDPLDEDRAVREIERLVDADVESIVVSMLFSYLNEEHERRIGDLIEEADADVDYALASSVHPEIREYERTITTVLNEAIKTTVKDYFARLVAGIEDRGITVPLNVVHSGGGIFTAEQATERAVRTITSGPAAGAVAAQKASEQEGFENAIGMDMGGTSADVSIVRDGEIVRSTEGEVNDLPVKTPMIDVNTVGAGGGSIAWLDDGGILRVGPESAGADPGPICYGRGGERPTLTDANLLLGRLDPANFLEGEMELAVERTRDIFREHIAEPLGESIEEAALSVVDVANASISRKVHNVTVERGDDPRDFALVAFGGAGPLQAPAVARQMDIETVLVPQSPGVFSARGILIADVSVDESHSYRGDGVDPDVVDEQVRSLESDVLARLDDQGFDDSEVTVDRSLDLRYAGQSYELTVPVGDGAVDVDAIDACKRSFHDKHARIYGYSMDEETVEAVTVRVNGRVPTPDLEDTLTDRGRDPLVDERDVYYHDDGYLPTDIYDRTRLDPDMVVEGPAILEESGSTSIVPPDTDARVTEYGNVVVTL